MQRLEALLKRYASNPRGARRWWVGERPRIAEGASIWREIAGRIGYPTSTPDDLAGGLTPLLRSQAAHVLVVAGTISLAYERYAPSEAEVREAAEALTDLAPDATFLSNRLWEDGANTWTPLTTATFDCGLIGYDASNAFVLWAEDED